MAIAVPSSLAHDAPEHLRLTLHGGKQFNKYDSAKGWQANADGKDEEAARLLKQGLSQNSICRILHISDIRASRIAHELDYIESTKGAI